MAIKHLDPEQNFLLYRSGIKLVPKHPAYVNDPHITKLQSLLGVGCCSYATNLDHRNIIINQAGLDVCGYQSVNDAFKHTMADIADDVSAQRVFSYQRNCIKKKTTHFIEDEVILKDGTIFQSLNIVKPLYDTFDNIIGIYGFSIIPDKHSITSNLAILSKLNILNSNIFYDSKYNYLNTLMRKNIYLSKREWECLNFICKGYSVKIISRFLNLSTRTIEFYIQNLCKKLNVSNKTEVARFLDEK